MAGVSDEKLSEAAWTAVQPRSTVHNTPGSICLLNSKKGNITEYFYCNCATAVYRKAGVLVTFAWYVTAVAPVERIRNVSVPWVAKAQE